MSAVLLDDQEGGDRARKPIAEMSCRELEEIDEAELSAEDREWLRKTNQEISDTFREVAVRFTGRIGEDVAEVIREAIAGFGQIDLSTQLNILPSPLDFIQPTPIHDLMDAARQDLIRRSNEGHIRFANEMREAQKLTPFAAISISEAQDMVAGLSAALSKSSPGDRIDLRAVLNEIAENRGQGA